MPVKRGTDEINGKKQNNRRTVQRLVKKGVQVMKKRAN